MTRMNSRPVQITQVYPQDTQPSDTRSGILWVDTSVSPPKTKTYDAATASWEPVATKNVHIQDTAPSAPENGEIWVDTSTTPPRTKVYDTTNAVWDQVARKARVDSFRTDFDNHTLAAEPHHTRPTSTLNEGPYEGGWRDLGISSFDFTTTEVVKPGGYYADGFEVRLNNQDSDEPEDATIRFYNSTGTQVGTVNASLATNEAKTVTWSFAGIQITDIGFQADGLSSFAKITASNLKLHEVSMPEHSHSI